MHDHLRRCRTSRIAAVLSAWLVACAAAAAEPHEIREGGLILRGELMASGELDPAAAQRQDIPSGRNRAVLDVTLVRAADGRHVPAVVSASSRGPAGERQKILVREVKRGTGTAYLGSFAFTPGQELEFVVEARPAQQRDGQLLTLTFRERMPPR